MEGTSNILIPRKLIWLKERNNVIFFKIDCNSLGAKNLLNFRLMEINFSQKYAYEKYFWFDDNAFS